MTPEELRKMTRAELLALAREKRLRPSAQATRVELIEAIAAADKRKRAPSRPKAGAKASKKTIAPEAKRIEAAKKVARLFIAGVKEKRRAVRKPAREEAPRREAAKPAPPTIPAPRREMPRPAPVKVPPPRQEPPRPAPVKVPAPRQEPPRPAPVKAPEVKTAPVKAPAMKAPAAKTSIDPRAAKLAAGPPAAAKTRAPKAPKAPRKKPAPPRAASEAAKDSPESIRRMAEEGKFYLGAESRVMPPVEAIDVPHGYNVDRIVAMVRDPYWVFSYWEVTDRKYRELERAFGETWPACKMILRVYDKTSEKESHFDIALTHEARTWYINVSAQRRYQIAIGALSPDGRFELVAISNIVETPSGRVSDRIDEDWMVPDDVFDRIFAASGGYDMHSASGELKGLLEKRLLEELSSGAVSSFGSGALYERAKGRAFRLWVATELILYGGTEPDAHVAVQGKEVKLRPDGTFSLRFALPDGKIDLPVTAVSGDGLEERTIGTDVTKKSSKKAPVLK
jgi:hypothetical protein